MEVFCNLLCTSVTWNNWFVILGSEDSNIWPYVYVGVQLWTPDWSGQPLVPRVKVGISCIGRWVLYHWHHSGSPIRQIGQHLCYFPQTTTVWTAFSCSCFQVLPFLRWPIILLLFVCSFTDLSLSVSRVLVWSIMFSRLRVFVCVCAWTC